jgi:hypothetical protein
MIMTKSALKLILCWALVTVVSATGPEIANVNFFCTTPDDANHDHCSQEILEGSLTPDQKMMDIFNRCVFRETGANLDFDVPFSRRALRTAAAEAAANDEAGDRSLGPCDACVCSEACCMMGYCGSSCSCTCACERRRLEDENEVISILQGRWLFLPDVAELVEASCTSEVRLLAILLLGEDNLCLGSDHEQIVCTPAVITTTA